MTEPRWLSVAEISRLHRLQIHFFGGSPGTRDAGLLESAAVRPRQRYHYGELAAIPELAAAYAVALSANHPFIDGNKRVAFHSLLVFLRLNGLVLRVQEQEATNQMLALAAGQSSEDSLIKWLRQHATA